MKMKFFIDIKITEIFFKLICITFSLLESYFHQNINKRERGYVRKIRMRGTTVKREQLQWQLRLVIHVLAYQNAAARTPYIAMIARTNNLSRTIIATTANIPIASNRAIRYSGRTYGNVYRQTGRS